MNENSQKRINEDLLLEHALRVNGIERNADVTALRFESVNLQRARQLCAIYMSRDLLDYSRRMYGPEYNVVGVLFVLALDSQTKEDKYLIMKVLLRKEGADESSDPLEEPLTDIELTRLRAGTLKNMMVNAFPFTSKFIEK